MALDHHNGKVVTGVTPDSIAFDDGTVIGELLSLVPDEIVATKLLKVVTDEDVAYLHFGHSYDDGRQPTVVAVVEATETDLRGEDV